MNKIIVVLIAIGVIGAGGYFIAKEVGFITPSTEYPTATQIPFSTASLASMIEDDQIQDILNQIQVTIYGVNNKDAQTVMAWYDSVMIKDGWNLVKTWQGSGTGWSSIAKGWQKGITGEAILVWSGSKVKQKSNYDCVIVVATAPLSVWEKILRS